jgi:ubiquinone/menaquinone biosynthesis C-methylase UbiE
LPSTIVKSKCDKVDLAQLYADKNFWQREEGQKLLEGMEIQEGSSVLDVGCGTGELTIEIAKLVGLKGRVTAIDLDSGRLEKAKKNKSDVEWLNLGIGEFKPKIKYDYCFSNFVLHWIENQPEALDKIQSSLKPKGKFGFSVIAYVPSIIQGITRTIGPESSKLLDGFFNPSRYQWTTMVNKAGFKVVKAERYSIEVNYGKLNDFFDWWIATSHGVFDPKKIAATELLTLKKMFPRDLVVDHPLISVVAEKI